MWPRSESPRDVVSGGSLVDDNLLTTCQTPAWPRQAGCPAQDWLALKRRLRRISGKWDIPLRAEGSWWPTMSPPQLFVASFAVLVVLGTLGLKLLPGLYTGPSLTWLDALFTSTSAVCVTGLIVEDTATFFTPAGQAFVLLLIQLGGIGMLTFASLIILALGQRMSLSHEAGTVVASEYDELVDRRRLTIDIVRFTLLFELIGALLLYSLWVQKLGWDGAAWPAVFHSVSGFCNAGFSTFSDSLIGFQESPWTLLVIMLLFIAGGLGFLTHEELFLRIRSHRRHATVRLTLQARLILATTLALILVGAALFALFEWRGELDDLTWGDRLMNVLFLSVTPRTAGFNSVDYALLSDSSNLLTILLMNIGGSPGSTAGGVKTTTIAIILLMAWSRLRGFETTSCFGRSIPEGTTYRAVALFVIATAIVVAGLFVLTATESREKGGVLEWMFEASSAFNTVGLSMGVTGDLTAAGRWTTILLMFFGRVGPLTIAAALTLPRSGTRKFRFAHEDVVVG